MSQKTLIGIEFEGLVHRDFALRIPAVGDTIDAVNAITLAGGNAESLLEVQIGILARCLTRLGDIPAEVRDYAWLRANLPDEDFELLWAELVDLKKKRREQSYLPAACDS